MNNRLLGILCLIGGAVKLIPALLSIAMPQNPSIENIVYLSGIIAFPLLMAGPISIFRQRAFGSAGKATLGMIGFAIAIFGLSFYLVNYLLGPAPLRAGLAAISTAVGMTVLGVAVLMAHRISGWRLFAPIAVGLAYFFQVIFQIVFRLGEGQSPLSWLLGIWWFSWMILGYAIATQKVPDVAANTVALESA